jgi:subtilisin family serine protease
MESYGVEFKHQYNAGSHKGFAAKITDQKVLALLQEDPLVMAIEANVFFTLDQLDCQTPQTNAPSWGIARVSQEAALASEQTYNYGLTGKGVNVYIIDTGIYTAHNDFGGRASVGVNYVTGESNQDENGHGTHCAGTAAGNTFGVAKGATLIAVKVLNRGGSGTFDNVVAGVSWVVNHNSNGNKKVSSMSLGAQGTYPALTSAVQASARAGVPVVVAAGNSNANACSFTPAGVTEAITVGSTERTDRRSSFSNYGNCLDIWAPGTSITSAWIGSPTATNTISGTSMACPHVAGYVSILFEENPSIDNDAIHKYFNDFGNKDKITGIPTSPLSPNSLLWNGCKPINP